MQNRNRQVAIISSQHFRCPDIVESYIQKFSEDTPKSISLPCWRVFKIVDGKELYILADGHHRREAALQLNIPIEYTLQIHPENVVRYNLLNQSYNDGDYYYIDDSDPEYMQTVW